MAGLKPTFDPYRVLGVLRGATQAEVKAAHRKLAKRYHPDGEAGNEIRFLAVQEAYQLLSDPVRRREWDRAHSPGPVRGANEQPPRSGGVAGTADASAAQRSGSVRRGSRASRPRQRTWSATHVPWWEDFQPGTKQPRSAANGDPSRRDGSATNDARTEEEPNEFDVFDRSSGAAWSAAARRHFRRGTDDLPSRGVWRYRGTQVVTGAEARRLADEEEEEKTPR